MVLAKLTLASHDVHFDEWEGDMKSRVYWNCLMNETILVQELHVPPSGLSRLEEYVPIPKFITFESVGFPASRSLSLEEIDDSFFQYHFLAQVAHRIILTRIRHSLYFHCVLPYPHPAIFIQLTLRSYQPTPAHSPTQQSTPNSVTN